MSGTLYICGTPIGNLEDITMRVLRILREADFIAAEDTRHTLKLLNHFEINTPLISYHSHNQVEKNKVLLEKLWHGKNIALVSDAGMPGISDPGMDIIRLCHEEQINVTIAPGPTAFATALVLSGLSSDSFLFLGFLPQNRNKKLEVLSSLKNENHTLLFYESPHHLLSTLEAMNETFGTRKMAAVRELTKIYEEVRQGTIAELSNYYKENSPRGEYVLVIEGVSKDELLCAQTLEWNKIPIEEHVKMYIKQGHSEKEAMKLAAKDRGVGKRDIYAGYKKI